MSYVCCFLDNFVVPYNDDPDFFGNITILNAMILF